MKSLTDSSPQEALLPFSEMLCGEVNRRLTTIIVQHHLLGIRSEYRFREKLLGRSNALLRLISALNELREYQKSSVMYHLTDIRLQDLLRASRDRNMARLNDSQITCQLDLPFNDIQLLGDYDKLMHVLDELFSNSIRSMVSGGEIVISLRMFEHVDGILASRIIFRDNGIGIKDKHLPHIFEPLYQVHRSVDRPGLGLCLVYEIIKAHMGSIEVTSCFTEGTTTILDLPCAISTDESYNVT